MVVAMLQRRLSFANLTEALLDAVVSTAKIFFIAIGAVLLTKFLAITGTGAQLAQLSAGLQDNPVLLLAMMVAIYLVLGMFLDPIGILLITIPVFLPILKAIDFDLVLYGVLVVKFIEIGLLTPPVGLNVFVIKSVVGDEVTVGRIFSGVTWFLLCEVIVVTLLFSFPEISLFLPSLQ
jgi:TRAP-type C4-dicarboxylate transport system permease large subunit